MTPLEITFGGVSALAAVFGVLGFVYGRRDMGAAERQKMHEQLATSIDAAFARIDELRKGLNAHELYDARTYVARDEMTKILGNLGDKLEVVSDRIGNLGMEIAEERGSRARRDSGGRS